jgi:hypothetical protein
LAFETGHVTAGFVPVESGLFHCFLYCGRSWIGIFLLDEMEENEFVIESFQRTSWRLFIPFQKIVHRVGLETIDMPFRNMCRCRSNEVEREFGTINESLWIGHSAKVKQDHYFRLTDEDFSSAAGAAVTDSNSHAKTHARPQEESVGLDGK